MIASFSFFGGTRTPIALTIDALKLARRPFIAVTDDGIRLGLRPRSRESLTFI